MKRSGYVATMQNVLSITESERVRSVEIWIDPSKTVKEGSVCGTWLPSPVRSILAARNCLHLLSARRRCLRRNPSCHAPFVVSSSTIIESVPETEEVHSHGSSEIAFLRLSTVAESKLECVPCTHQESFKVYISMDYTPPSPSFTHLETFSPRRLWRKHFFWQGTCNLCNYPGLHAYIQCMCI